MQSVDSIEALATLIAHDDPNVMIVVGSGVSIGATKAGFASWQGLLLNGVDRLVELGQLDAELATHYAAIVRDAFRPGHVKMGEILQRAEAIVEGMGGQEDPRFARWLEETVGTLRFEEADASGATIRALRDLFECGVRLATTNYDSLLTQATGAPPVTWQDRLGFLQVANGRRRGILHIHGHWSSPSSIVLSRTSYAKVQDALPFQAIFKGLGLQFTWILAGFGSSLDDPNLGRLLKWIADEFGDAAPMSYLLTLRDEAEALACSPRRPPHLAAVGFDRFEELPEILRSLVPIANVIPFERMGPTLRCAALRDAGASPADVPFPSWQDFASGLVPLLDASRTIEERLQRYGWAFVEDSPSVGKSTAALSLASARVERGEPAFYLSLKKVPASDPEGEVRCLRKYRRLRRSGVLVLVDDVHHNPLLAERLWDEWRERPNGSQLLLLCTRTTTRRVSSEASVLSFFRNHLENPAVTVRPTVRDLARIYRHVFERLGASRGCPEPPDTVLENWLAAYGSELGAFCIAVTANRALLAAGHWELPASLAAQWVRTRHLERRPAEVRENLIALAAAEADGLELDLPAAGLPHRGSEQDDLLLATGLVEKTSFQGRRSAVVGLVGHGLGRLFLAAIEPAPDAEQLRREASARCPEFVPTLQRRLLAAGRDDEVERLWQFLLEDQRRMHVFAQLVELPLNVVPAWFRDLSQYGTRDQVREAHEAMLARLPIFRQTLTVSPLTAVVAILRFLEGREGARLRNGVWAFYGEAPEIALAQCLSAPLHFVSSFFDSLYRVHGEALAERLWTMLGQRLEDLVAAARLTPLGHCVSFYRLAFDHGKSDLASSLWKRHVEDPDEVAEQVREAPLLEIIPMFQLAELHRDQAFEARLWEALGADEDPAAFLLSRNSLSDIGRFLSEAHERAPAEYVRRCFEGLAVRVDALLERSATSTPANLAYFLDVCIAIGQTELASRSWRALAVRPDSLLEKFKRSSLDDIGTFFDTAHRQEAAAPPEQANVIASLIDTLGAGLLEDVEHLRARITRSTPGSVATLLRGVPRAMAFCLGATLEADDVRACVSTALAGGHHGILALAERLNMIDRLDLEDAVHDELWSCEDSVALRKVLDGIRGCAMVLGYFDRRGLTRADEFVSRVVTRGWLSTQYAQSECDNLAYGLFRFATEQPVAIRNRFRHGALPHRVFTELRQADRQDDRRLCDAVRLIGAADVFGEVLPPRWFQGLPVERLARLPVEVLPHAPGEEYVLARQRHLWLGLRTIECKSGLKLPLSDDALEQTLARWRANLLASEARLPTGLLDVDRSMVTWLGRRLGQ